MLDPIQLKDPKQESGYHFLRWKNSGVTGCMHSSKRKLQLKNSLKRTTKQMQRIHLFMPILAKYDDHCVEIEVTTPLKKN